MDIDKTLPEFISEIKICLQSNKFDSALNVLLDAIKIFPNEVSLIINIGNIHNYRGRPDQAESYYKKAIEIEESKEAYNNLSVIYLDSNNIDLAISCAKKAIAIDSNYIDAHCNAALALQRNSDYESAITHAKIVLKHDESNEKALIILYSLYQNTCNWCEMDLLEKKLDSMVGNGEEHPFMGISRTDNLEVNYNIAKSYVKKNCKKIEEVSNFEMIGGGIESSESQDKKIKIGYLCGELRNHPTYHLIKNLFKSHDANKFEIFIFSFRHDEEIKKELKKDIYKFLDITDITDTSAAQIIKEYELDVLIDLSIIIASNRIDIVKSRPAKKIISYLGFPGTSGHDFYDYILTDQIVTPLEHQSFYTEKFLYMPGCYQINSGESKFSESNTSREEHFLPEKAIVLACFNQSFKIDASTFKCWIEILKELPNSVLWLLSDNKLAEKNIYRYLRKNNIKDDRLIFAEKVSREKHLQRLKLADVAIDTSIYNGHTTTTDALQVGLPVITKTGNHFASRVSTSLLLSLGLNELCCQDIISYKKKIIEICSEDNVKSRIVNKLTSKNKFETIHDNKKFANNLEQTLMGIL